MKTCIVTGINGQLGQYFAKYLQENEPDIQIIGTLRHKSYDKQDYIFDKTKVIFELMDLSDSHSIENLVLKYKSDYFFNFSANAFVGDSWKLPAQQVSLNFLGVIHQLEAIRKHSPHTKYFNMGTSEEFACVENNGPQDENTLISPRSPYGCCKAAARYIVDIFRHSYNLYAIQGWTFNFESKLRGPKYLTRKVTENVARIFYAIKDGKDFEPLELGNMYSFRSWQHASDVAAGVWKIMHQQDYNKNWLITGDKDPIQARKHFINQLKPYVLSATDTYSVKEFVERAFAAAGITGYWEGEGLEEKFYLTSYKTENGGHAGWFKESKKIGVQISEKFFRPLDVTFLHGDASKIKKELGWETTVSFDEIVKEMVQNDLDLLK